MKRKKCPLSRTYHYAYANVVPAQNNSSSEKLSITPFILRIQTLSKQYYSVFQKYFVLLICLETRQLLSLRRNLGKIMYTNIPQNWLNSKLVSNLQLKLKQNQSHLASNLQKPKQRQIYLKIGQNSASFCGTSRYIVTQ